MTITMRPWVSMTSFVLPLAALLGAAAILQACTSFSAAETPPVTADGGGTGDGGLEASASEAGTSGFCAMHPGAVVCSDFDSVSEPRGWTIDTRGGTLQAVDTVSFSPPRSLRGTIDGMMVTSGRLTHSIPAVAKHVRLSFEIELGQLSLQAKQQISIAEIFCGGGGVDEGAYVFVEDSPMTVAAYTGDSASTRTALPSLTNGNWTAVVLDAHFDAAPPTVTVSIGGVRSAPLVLAKSCTNDSVFEVRVGISTYTGVTGQGFFDDLLFEVDPP